MSSSQSDAELLARLIQIKGIFDKYELKNSSNVIQSIHTELQSSITTRVDAILINNKFKDLQTAIVTDFATDPYRGKIISKFTTNFRKSLKLRIKQVVRIFNTKRYSNGIKRRADAFRNLTLLKGMVTTCAKDDEQSLIGISYAYLSLIEGVYKRSLIDCYLWERLAEKRLHRINTTKLVRMDINEIYCHFKQQRLGTHYFKGWKRTIRNAVGHSTFHYDPSTAKMIYEDLYILNRRGRRVYKRTESYSMSEMIKIYENAECVYHAVMFTNQILRANEACTILIQRHP